MSQNSRFTPLLTLPRTYVRIYTHLQRFVKFTPVISKNRETAGGQGRAVEQLKFVFLSTPCPSRGVTI